MVGQGGVETVFGDARLFEDSIAAHLFLTGDDLPHVERRTGHPRAAAALRAAKSYAGVPLGPGRLFGGSSETIVLSDVQHDTYAFSTLVGKVAHSHFYHCSALPEASSQRRMRTHKHRDIDHQEAIRALCVRQGGEGILEYVDEVECHGEQAPGRLRGLPASPGRATLMPSSRSPSSGAS